MSLADKVAQFNWKVTQDIWAITINPNDDNQYHDYSTTDKRFFHDRNKLNEVTLNLFSIGSDGKRWIKYIRLWPDVSFPEDLCLTTRKKRITKIPRIHYHGLLKLTPEGVEHIEDVFLLIIDRFVNYAIFNIDTVEDIEGWINYCKKFINIFPKYKKYILKRGRMLPPSPPPPLAPPSPERTLRDSERSEEEGGSAETSDSRDSDGDDPPPINQKDLLELMKPKHKKKYKKYRTPKYKGEFYPL